VGLDGRDSAVLHVHDEPGVDITVTHDDIMNFLHRLDSPERVPASPGRLACSWKMGHVIWCWVRGTRPSKRPRQVSLHRMVSGRVGCCRQVSVALPSGALFFPLQDFDFGSLAALAPLASPTYTVHSAAWIMIYHFPT
jgi:hypothetical protein